MPLPFTQRRGRAALRLLLSLWSALLAHAANAQGWLGLAQSNYAGTNAVYQNPSAIADSRYKVYVNLAGFDANFYNTYLQFNVDKRPWQAGFSVSRANLTEQGNGGPHFANVSGEVRLPSLMLTLGKRSTLAFTNRVRAFAQVSNLSDNLAKLSLDGLYKADSLGLANRLLNDNSANVNVSGYHEFALTYARTFTANTEHFLKGGLTVKYLVGLGAAYGRNEGTQYQVYNGDSIQLQSRNLSYATTDYQLYGSNGFKYSSLYGSNKLGSGLGADLGITYEWRPDYEQYQYHMDNADWTDNTRNKYRLRLGLALTDLGAIRYNNQQYVQQGNLANNGTVQIGQLDTLRVRHYQDVQTITNRLTGFTSTSHEFTTYLPAALRLSADYRLAKGLYGGVLLTQNLLGKSTIGSRSISSLALVPRYELKYAELAIPLVLANNYRQVQVGAMLRVGPLIIGSDNLGGILGLKNTTGADVYAALSVGLGRFRHKDKDGDQVSNKLDQCPTVKGVWEFRGCPDRDGDHVPDSADECPDTPGLAQFKGCPDTDGDGIPDKLDACPTEAGLPQFQGCPDRDKDGIKDGDDACPDTPGLAQFKGCPDTDGDGTPDPDDKCPTVPGPIDNHGCPPDRDGDGVVDTEDACPDTPGPASNKGCPEVKVEAPTVADTDGDGVPDATDLCPLTPGPASNQGCPELKPEEAKVVNTAFANLEFETNKDIIRATSLPSLRELAELLKTHPEFRLRLRGYTDNVGTAAFNLALSKKRALAVQRYLLKQGVPPKQVKSEWFGRKNPVASNKTPAGRAKNRRVEMRILFE